MIVIGAVVKHRIRPVMWRCQHVLKGLVAALALGAIGSVPCKAQQVLRRPASRPEESATLARHPAAAAQADTTALAPLTVDAVLTLKSFPRVNGFVSVTPDGRWFAYAVRDAADWPVTDTTLVYSVTGVFNSAGHGTDIWITDGVSGTTRNITAGKGTSWSPQWSPDGRRLAFYSDRGGVAQLWIWDRITGELRRLADAPVRPFYDQPVWSPDGSWIAVKLLPEGMTVLAANRLTTRNEPKLDSTVVAGATVTVFRYTGERADSGFAHRHADIGPIERARIDTLDPRPDALADMALISVANGRARRLEHRKFIEWYAFSPDGSKLAYTRRDGVVVGTQQDVSDLMVASVRTGATRVMVRQTPTHWATATWSPDGDRIAYAATGQLARGDIYALDVSTGAVRCLTPSAHPRFEGLYDYPMQLLWSSDGHTVYFVGANTLWQVDATSGGLVALTPDKWDHDVMAIVSDGARSTVWSSGSGGGVTITTRSTVTKEAGFYRVDLRARDVTKLREESKRYGFLFTAPFVTEDGSNVVYMVEDAQHPPDLWVTDTGFTAPRQVTSLNAGISAAKLGKTRVIDYLAPNGTMQRAALLLPADYQEGKRYPLLLRVYPGNDLPNSDEAFRFGLEHATDIGNMQLLASRGYAVLYPDIRQRVGTPMQDLVAGANAAVNRVIELGIADPERLGVFGQSYGGYATIAIITQTARFKAAVMSAGSGNLLGTWYFGLFADGASGEGWAERGQGLMGGTPWQYRERYIENSPIFYLDRVTTPLLIVQGEADKPEDAEAVFVGLRRLGKVVEYRRYANSGHVVAGKANLADYWNAVFRWFDDHLSNETRAVAVPSESATGRRSSGDLRANKPIHHH